MKAFPMMLALLLIPLVSASIVPIPPGEEFIDWRYVSSISIDDKQSAQSLFATITNQLGSDSIAVGDVVTARHEHVIEPEWSYVYFQLYYFANPSSNGELVYSNSWSVCQEGCDINLLWGATLTPLSATFTPTIAGEYVAKFKKKQGSSYQYIDTTSFHVSELGATSCPADNCGSWGLASTVYGGVLETQSCLTYNYVVSTSSCDGSPYTNERLSCNAGYSLNAQETACVLDDTTCSPSEWNPSTGDVCSGSVFTQESDCDTTRSATGTKDCSCQDSSWLPLASTMCAGSQYTQTSNCGSTRTSVGTKSCSCTVSSWEPAESGACDGITFTQTSNCGTTRNAVGTKTCNTGASCETNDWLPARSDYCEDVEFYQTNECGDVKKTFGTKYCVVSSVDNSGSNTDNVGNKNSLLTLLIIGAVGYGAYYLIVKKKILKGLKI